MWVCGGVELLLRDGIDLVPCKSLAKGFRKSLPGPSNVVPFWVWYDFLVRTPIRTTKKVLHWRA